MSVLGSQQEEHVSSAFQFAAELQQRAATQALCVENSRERPFMLLRPRMFPDGNQWCALYGENIQEGVCGFGDTPNLASYDFDNNWYGQKLMVEVKHETI
jgi:hypothetical protein